MGSISADWHIHSITAFQLQLWSAKLYSPASLQCPLLTFFKDHTLTNTGLHLICVGQMVPMRQGGGADLPVVVG